MSGLKKKLVKSGGIKEDVASDNAKTIEAKDNKSNQLAMAVTLMASMKGDEINNLLATLQQNSQTAAAGIPDDAAAKNAASIAAKGVMKEDLELIFGGEDLAEDFKEKISTLFESAVSTRVTLELSEMEEKFDAILEEQSASMVETLTEQINKYMTYVASEWMKENELAIESGIRTEIAENFINGLKDLFQEHYIEIPDEKVDVLEQYASRVSELEDELNTLMTEKIELENREADSVMESTFELVSNGLALTQVEKFRTLAEGIEFDGDVDTYKRKLNIIKEKHFVRKPVGSTASLVISESVNADTTEDFDPTVMRYAEALSKITKS